MRDALRQHDFRAVYRLLSHIGYSQSEIGRLTGQSQPEISAIMYGRRVMAYDVMARIAGGLGIPAGYLGLSWCTCPYSTVLPNETAAVESENSMPDNPKL
jgi:transcriptional regulator with XRE-family HTH domain